MIRGYEDYTAYYGDIHNHCGISYGHGTLEDALTNAQLQLDFCSVTGHGHWPDMPQGEERLAGLVEYHETGFAKLRRHWDAVRQTTETYHVPDEFVTFLSYEWHCMRSGDHTIVYKRSEGNIIPAETLADLKATLAQHQRRGIEAIVMPHHISYHTGYRGINWSDFTQNFSPIVELVSMHGCGESDDAPYPPLHTMGPRDFQSTAQYGLALGHIFGFVGNTDHHSAHPGSYGCGRTGVWAESLSRDSIWRAIQARRTYALTGDRIGLQFSVNGNPMGSMVPEPSPERSIEVHVAGGAPIDYVEIVKNNRPIHRMSATDVASTEIEGRLRTKLYLEVGWGKPVEQLWDVHLRLSAGEIIDIEPRFRGEYVVAPKEDDAGEYQYTSWSRDEERGVRFRTLTRGNPTVLTNASQGISLDVEMPMDGNVTATINGKTVSRSLRELVAGSHAGYVGGFVSGAYRFHRAPRPEECKWDLSFQDLAGDTGQRDFYYVRVCQKNGQWAWSSPVWIG